ncbi:MAG: ribonuclease H-like domain-containing protein [Spirochaeta sp.]
MDLADRLRQRRRSPAARFEPGSAASSEASCASVNPTSAVDLSALNPPEGWEHTEDLLWERRVYIPYPQGEAAPASSSDSALPGPISLTAGAFRSPVRDMMFFDIETTGLSSGAGTTVLLAGAARLQPRGLMLQQWFAVDFPGEVWVLQRLSEALSEAKVLVSYNGKSFDWPVVQSKALMSGILLPELLHLDLLHPVRGLFRRRLPDCSLTTIEQQVLGIVREEDIPGSEVPLRYSDFTRTGLIAPLSPVFAHHLRDIQTLVDLLCFLRHLSGRPEAAAQTVQFDPVGLARLRRLAGKPYLEMLQTGFLSLLGGADAMPPAVRALDVFRTGRLLVQQAKRMGESDTALEYLLQMQSVLGIEHEWTAVELAKLYEHRYQDVHKALAVLEPLPGGAQLDHRRRRLYARIRRYTSA